MESSFFHLHLNTKVKEALETSDAMVTNNFAALTEEDARKGMHWISFDDEKALKRLPGQHARMALKAKSIKQMPIKGELIATSKLVKLHPNDEGELCFMTKALYKTKEITHITGLVDEHFFSVLLTSLWIDAGRPPVGTASLIEPKGASEEEMKREFQAWHEIMKDRCNWSRHNLCLFSGWDPRYRGYLDKLGYKFPIQSLVALQQYTSESYLPVLSMPVYLLSMVLCNNMKPFERTLIPTDQLECISHGQRPTSFHLDRRVFDSGSQFLQRKTLRKLGAALKLFSSEEGEIGGNSGARGAARGERDDDHDHLKHLKINASPLCSITLDDKSRKLAGIPEEAVFFCCSFAISANAEGERIVPAEVIAQAGLSEEEAADAWSDPFFNLLIVGAFLYFNMSYQIIGVSALCFTQMDQATLDKHAAAKGSLLKIFYGRPQTLPPSAIRPINQNERWIPVSVPVIQQYGFTHYAWIKPSEFLGDHTFPKNGGFAYLHKDWRETKTRSKFFPIITPKDTAYEVYEEVFDLAQDGDKAYEAKEFAAPLHIPEFLVARDQVLLGDDAEQKAAKMSKMSKFVSDIDMSESEGKSVNEISMADARQSARGVEQQLGFDSTAELLAHQDVLLEVVSANSLSKTHADLLREIDEKIPNATCVAQVRVADEKYQPSARGSQKLKSIVSAAFSSKIKSPEDEHETIKQKHGRELVRRQRERYNGQAAVLADAAAKQAARAAAANDSKQGAGPKRVDYHFAAAAWVRSAADIADTSHWLTAEQQEMVAKMRAEEGAEEAWAHFMASERRPCYALFAEVLNQVAGSLDGLEDDRGRDAALAEAARHIDNVYYVLCSSAAVKAEKSNDGNTVAQRDKGRAGETLEMFATMDEAEECKLTMAEVAALRLYTTSTFRLINNPLRQSVRRTAHELRKERHPLAITCYHITCGLKKLRALNFHDLTTSSVKKDSTLCSDSEPDKVKHHEKSSYLWRGLKDLTISSHFMAYGGSEIACMSTSESLNVIAGYAQSEAPLLFRIKVDSPMDRGASIQWLSVYPEEDEVLYPPLMYLQPLLKQKIRGLEGGEVVTVKVVYPS